MESKKIMVGELLVGDYILTRHIGPKEGEWSGGFHNQGNAWLIKQVQISGNIVFLVVSGHQIGDSIWFNRPDTIFHFALPAFETIEVQTPRAHES